jgi:thymidylate kinase
MFERQEFLAKVKDNYEMIFSDLPSDVTLLRIDGQKSREEITSYIVGKLRERSLL